MKRRWITGNPFRLKRSLLKLMISSRGAVVNVFNLSPVGWTQKKVKFNSVIFSPLVTSGMASSTITPLLGLGAHPGQPSTLEMYFSLNYMLLVCSLMAFVTKGHYSVRITVALLTFLSKLFWIQIFAILHERMHGLAGWFSFFYSVFPEWQF